MTILALILPDVKGTTEERPKHCPYCQKEQSGRKILSVGLFFRNRPPSKLQTLIEVALTGFLIIL